MRALFDGIPLAEMNTSMTINATAMWLLALYQVVAEEQAGPAGRPAADVAAARGTTQNDIIKEYLSRGTYVFPPAASLRLTTDLIAYTVDAHAAVEPDQHLQLPPAGGRRDAGAGDRVRAVAPRSPCSTRCATPARCRRSGSATSSRASRSSSTPACGSSRRCARCARSCELWDELTRERYGVTDPKQRRFRYGVQVNSLGLTEAQPENNVQRIVLEMLGVTLSKDARARAVQLPAWNEALGLPRPWDQQWSLRMQQVLAYESDLLEYDDLFDGSPVVEAKVDELVRRGARRDRPGPGDGRRGRGGRERLHEVRSWSPRTPRAAARIESGEDVVVGVNRFTDDRAEPAAGRPRRRHPDGRPGGRGSAAVDAVARLARRPRRSARSSAALARLRDGRRDRRRT